MILDCREGDRGDTAADLYGTNRRRMRRRRGEVCPYLKLGWIVLDTNELAP